MIKITTDSTCDLPRELLERYNITVTPLGIIKAGKLYQDGVDIRTGDIAAHVDAGGEITTTNAVNVADYEELFRRLMEEYDAVIHLNIGMGFSSCHQNARLAAEEVDGVYVVDSANLTVGHGMLVLAAAEAAEAGKSVTEILAMLEEMIPRVETSFVLDRLDYMKKGGRCSTATALGASLLKLHPCLDVVDGKLPVTKRSTGAPSRRWWRSTSGTGCGTARTWTPAGPFWWTPARTTTWPPSPGRSCVRTGGSRRSSRPRRGAPSSVTAAPAPWA